jgi:pyruvate formate lyase activating enzyme
MKKILAVISLILFSLLLPISAGNKTEKLKEAFFYKKLDAKKVACQLCPRYCIIDNGKRGFCRNRENQEGKLYSIVYGKPCSIGKEPIEKAPFYHLLPGRERITLATVSCNQRCKYCQNWEISQAALEERYHYDATPEDIVSVAKKYDVKIICFTFTEPIVFYEYMYDIAKLAHSEGIKTCAVSGGFINPEPLKKLCKVLDAIKIDLKGFDEKFYEDICGSQLQPVLDACKTIKEANTHLEIVNLVVPTLNDDTTKIRQMCNWIKENLGDDVPIHFTRFGPAYKLTNLPPTPLTTLEKAIKIAHDLGLKYVYIGNMPGHDSNNTYCPKCKKLLIKRVGYSIAEYNIKDGKCKFCGENIKGIWTL